KVIFNDRRVLIIDESSKIKQSDHNKIIKLYPNSIIIYLGDICQLGPIPSPIEPNPKSIDFSKFHTIVYKKNYRCKCPKLKVILDSLRGLILGNHDLNMINKYAMDSLKNNKGTDDNYTTNDYIISGTKDKCIFYTEKHKDKPKRWLIKAPSKGLYVGDIIIQETQPPNSELRHCFTAHSLQGITIKNPNKIYIDPVSIFTKQMFYTILSRVEYLNQIVLI
ncbi:unnamed protein product, partial [marine sediment metagenome]